MQSISTQNGYRRPLGYQQITSATLAAATKLTLPSVTNGQQNTYAIIQNNGTTNVRWRDDGTAPTATVGMVLPAGGELNYSGDLALIQFIYVATGAILDVMTYA